MGALSEARPAALYLPRGNPPTQLPPSAEAEFVSVPEPGLVPNPNRKGPVVAVKPKIDFTPNPFRRHSRGRRGAAYRLEKPDRHADRALGKERDLRKDHQSRKKAYELRGLRGYDDLTLEGRKKEAHRARINRGEGGYSRSEMLVRVGVGMAPVSHEPRRRDAPKTRKAAKAAAAVKTDKEVITDVVADCKLFARTGRVPVVPANTTLADYEAAVDIAVSAGRLNRRMAKRMIEKLRLVGVELNPGPVTRYLMEDVYCPIGRPIRGSYYPLEALGIKKHAGPGELNRRYYRLKSRIRVSICIDPLGVEGDDNHSAYYCNYVEAKWESGPYDEYVVMILKLFFTPTLLTRDAHIKKFSCIGMLLLMAGIEPNPGPSGDAPHSDAAAGKQGKREKIIRDKHDKQKERSKTAAAKSAEAPKVVKTSGSGVMKSAVQKVVAQVEAEARDIAAKKAAVKDVEADKLAEAVAEQKKLVNLRRGEELKRVQEDLDSLVGTAFHNVVPRQAFCNWAEVQPSRRLLSRFPLPFRVTEVVELKAHFHCDLDDSHSLVSQTPADVRAFKPTEPHIIVRASARTFCYGWGFREIEGDGLFFSCTFSWDQFCDFRTSRCDEYSLDRVLNRVISFRRAGRTNPQDSRRYTTADLMADNIFAALHLVSTPNNDQAGAIMADMAVKGVTSVVERKIIGAAHGRLAPGVYVRGYEVGFDQMFPAEWKEAVDAVAAGSKTAKCALRAFFAAVTKTGCEIAESARAGLEQRLVRGREKAAKYCRMHGLHIDGLYPAFADPYDFGNILVSGCKRLLRRIADPTTEAQAYEEEAAKVLVGDAAGFPAEPSGGRDELREQAEMYAFSKKFNADQADEFVLGAQLVHDVRSRSVSLQDFADLVSVHIEKMKAFIKAEDYQKDEVKADRFIVCPNHFLRGVLWEVYRRPCEGFFQFLGLHGVKHRTPEENLEVTLSMFPECQDGDLTHLKTDGKNFESLINRFRRRLEQKVIRAFAHEEDHEMLTLLEYLLEKDFSICTQFIEMILSTIRRSGEYVTSCGNAICNHNMTMGMLAWAHEVPLPDVQAWIRRYREMHGWRFEGDDGIVVVHRRILTRFREAFAHFGVAMSMITSDLPSGFLKQELVNCADKMRVYRNPIDLLASLTSWIKCDGTSIKHDTDMLLARAASYLYMYRDIPLIASACWSVIRRYAKRWRQLADKAAAGAMDEASIKLREFWSRIEGNDYGAPGDTIAAWFRGRNWFDKTSDFVTGRIYLAPNVSVSDAPPQADPDMLSHCCVELGCSVADLASMTERIVAYFSHADDSPLAPGLALPEIREWMAGQVAMARMSIERVEDVRQRALVRAREAYAVAGAATVAKITLWTQWASHLFTILGTAVMVFQLKTLFVLFGWSSVPLYPVLMALFLPLFMMAIGLPVYLILHWGLQLPKAVARGVVTGSMWTVLFVEIAAAVRVYQVGIEGLAGLINAAGQAPTTAWSAATGLLANAARGVLRRVI